MDLARSVLDKRIGPCDLFVDMVPFLSSHLAPYLRLPDIVYWNLLPSDLSWLRNKHSNLEEIYLAPIRVLARTFVHRWKRVQVHIANSNYTRNRIIERLSADLNPIVIYPPVDIPIWSIGSNSELRTGVASLSRFETWKRHDLQLKIARGLDERLRMIGRTVTYREIAHLAQLRAAVRGNDRTEFFPNVSQIEAKKILASSKVFLHTADAEPFGISVVEAIAAGCIPVVRNEGGVSEIVPYDELRFDTIQEAQEKIREALSGEFDHLYQKLKHHIQRFETAEFRKRFADCLSDIAG